MIVYRYRTLESLHEMVYTCRLGNTHTMATVDDYRAKFSKHDLHGQAIRDVVESMAAAAMNQIVSSFGATDIEACDLRSLVRIPDEVQLLRIDKPFRTAEDARHYLAKDMRDILADVEYRAFTTTITLN